MSYCRWSSMNMMCDVYVYENVSGGWTTHVAGNRLMFQPIPSLPLGVFNFRGKWDKKKRRVTYPNRRIAFFAHIYFKVFSWSQSLHSWSIGLIPRRNIGLQHDGKTFNSDTAGDCADLLESLRKEGYRVPQYAIDRLREEEAESA